MILEKGIYMKTTKLYSIFVLALSMVAATAIAQQEAQPAATGSVARASFTSGIDNREPVDQLQSLTNESGKVYFFTHLKDLQDQKITHRWEWNGQTMAEVDFNVGGSNWRVWSSKNLQKEWLGTWKVSVINGAGDVISTQEFNYEKAATPAMADTGTTDATDTMSTEQ